MKVKTKTDFPTWPGFIIPKNSIGEIETEYSDFIQVIFPDLKPKYDWMNCHAFSSRIKRAECEKIGVNYLKILCELHCLELFT